MTISFQTRSVKSTNVRLCKDVKTHIVHYFLSFLWIMSKSLAKYVVKTLFFKPRPYRMSQKEKEIIKRADRFTFQTGSKKIQGYHWGTGPGVVFVHGWAGRGVQFYRYVDLFIRKGFSVYTFDHTGHGESDGKTSNYFEFSNAVHEFMKLQKENEISAIVAHSLGASAAINYLARTGSTTKTILIAPALSLIDTLDAAFLKYGVPLCIFNALLKDIEKDTGHEFAKENPVDQIKLLYSDILLIHDTNDKAISYEDSWKASLLQDNIRLYSTSGLGHIRILQDRMLAGEIARDIEAHSPDNQ